MDITLRHGYASSIGNLAAEKPLVLYCFENWRNTCEEQQVSINATQEQFSGQVNNFGISEVPFTALIAQGGAPVRGWPDGIPEHELAIAEFLLSSTEKSD